jgi:hypothetical protein
VKVGRNAPCPCGSGKKYKKCCIANVVSALNREPKLPHEDVRQLLKAIRKRDEERIQKYGHVRPPITTKHAGQTFVAVGSRLLHDARWKTFHDFLFAYIGSLFEKEWFTNELSKPNEQRHPLMQWYHILQEFGKSQNHPTGQVRKIDSPPAPISALLSFAYDLYTIEHHAILSGNGGFKLRLYRFSGHATMLRSAATIRTLPDSCNQATNAA